MTNPVGFLVKKSDTGEAYFVPPADTRYALPVRTDKSGNLLFRGDSNPQTLWDDSACTSQLMLEEKGTVQKTSALKTVAGYKTQGRVSVTIQVIKTFDGTCRPSLEKMLNCYKDVTQCGGKDSPENKSYQAVVQELFNPFIEAGAMTQDEMPSITAVAYEVSYQ